MTQNRSISQFARMAKLLPSLAIGGSVLIAATPVLAHHAMGGKIPVNSVQGFLSGLAHPVIGLDHLAFVIAVGLLSATKRHGIWLPIAFVLSAMLGTGLHVMSVALPAVELWVSGSILLFGILLSLQSSLTTPLLAGLAAMAGLFHGYAYGEAIFGAEMSPLFAYLAGFSLIQLVIALSTFFVGYRLLKREPAQFSILRSVGLVICGVGIAFLSSQIVAAIFPV